MIEEVHRVTVDTRDCFKQGHEKQWMVVYHTNMDLKQRLGNVNCAAVFVRLAKKTRLGVIYPANKKDNGTI